MKKLIVILTVMCMVLTSMVVPMTVFGENSVNDTGNGSGDESQPVATCDFNIDPFGGNLKYIDSEGEVVTNSDQSSAGGTFDCDKTVGDQLSRIGAKEFCDLDDSDSLGKFEGWYRIVKVEEDVFGIDRVETVPNLYTTEDVNRFNIADYAESLNGYIKFVAKWEKIDISVYEKQFESNGNSGDEGPMGPVVPCSVQITGAGGEGIVESELFQDEPLEFECIEGDQVTMSVNVTDIGEFSDATFSWFKFVFPDSDDEGMTEMELTTGENYTVSGNTCTINEIDSKDIDNCDYVCRINAGSDTYTYRFAPCTEVSDDGPSTVVPNNRIIVSYSFYTASGQHNFFPISINIGNINEETGNVDLTIDGKTTIKELVEENGESLSDMHYQDPVLEFDEWVITGADMEVPNGVNLEELTVENCGGGFRVYANAKYKNDAAPVQTTLCYYDENNDYCEEEMVIVLAQAKGKTTEAVYETLERVGKLNVKHSEEYTFKEWDYPVYELYQESEELSSFYIEPLEIKATYVKQPVQVSCTYNDNGEAVTVTGRTIIDTSATLTQDLYTSFEAFLTENKVPVDGVIGWAFDSNTYLNWQDEGQPQDEITVAAIYNNSTPIYANRYSIKCDSVDNMYYNGHDPDEIIYVDSNYPSSMESAEGEAYNDKVVKVVDAKFGINPGAMTFKGYFVEYVEYTIDIVYQKDTDSYTYRCAPTYNLRATYDEVFVELVGVDGSVTQELCDPNEPYKLPGDADILWNFDAIGIGGDAISGGSEFQLVPPYVKFSVWTLVKKQLEEVPEQLTDKYLHVGQIQNTMDSKVKGEKPSWDTDKTHTTYFEVELKKAEEGSEPITHENFPKEGIWVMFDYPEGTDKDTDFVISHMFTEDVTVNGVQYKAGDVEIIKGDRLIKTDRGVKVKVYSLSPMSIAYDPTAVNDSDNGSGNGNQGNANDPNNSQGGQNASGTTTTDKVVDTGDNFSAVPFIAVMGIALAGVAVALFRRKIVK